MQFHHATLPNGLEIVAELNPRAYSVAAGFFVRTGARDESPAVSGVSHFLEHMAFKGNETFTADDVNRIFDEVGAKYNASTSEELTLFYAAVLPEYLPRTFQLLSALLSPSLREEDFTTEKQVILEEIGMYEDQPSFLTYDYAMQTHFAGHPLGQSILGTQDSITALSSDQMRRYHADRYRAGNLFLAVAGNGDWEEILRLAEQYCGAWPAGTRPRDVREAQPPGGVRFVNRPGNQQHTMQLGAAPPATSPLRFAAELLAVVVGDDEGSRLYWEIVDPGDADAAELSFLEFDGSGVWMTYLCCNPDQTADNLRRIAEILAEVNEQGISAEDLDIARNKVALRIVLQSERPMGRLSSLGGNWLYRREYRSVSDDLAAIRSVTPDDITALLRQYPLSQSTTVGVGPLEGLE